MSKAEFETWWAENDGNITDMLRSLSAAYANPLEIDDLKSETFLRCWCSNPNSAKDGYHRWVWTVAKSVVGDVLRQQRRQEEASQVLAQESNQLLDSVARIVAQRLILELRMEIVRALCEEWALADSDWDTRITKRRVVNELARRIRLSLPISSEAVGATLGLSPRHIRRLLRDIATDILEIENAEVQGVRCPDTVPQNERGQLATDESRRVKSHGNLPISRTL